MSFCGTIGSARWHPARQVDAPAVWGKLPSHADFVQRGVKAGDVQAWQHWLTDQARPPAACRPGTRSHPGEPWMALDVPTRASGQRDVPVAFILPPGTLSFAARRHVLGVVANSHDSLGRAHPVIVYQAALTPWLERHLVASVDDSRRWLFALARLVARYVQDARAEPDDGTRHPNARGVTLPEAVSLLWALYAPGWSHWLGMSRPPPSAEAVQAVLNQAPARHAEDAAQHLSGMPGLPWADWPQRLWGPHSQPAFWQQDARGGHIAASRRLSELWGR